MFFIQFENLWILIDVFSLVVLITTTDLVVINSAILLFFFWSHLLFVSPLLLYFWFIYQMLLLFHFISSSLLSIVYFYAFDLCLEISIFLDLGSIFTDYHNQCCFFIFILNINIFKYFSIIFFVCFLPCLPVMCFSSLVLIALIILYCIYPSITSGVLHYIYTLMINLEIWLFILIKVWVKFTFLSSFI